MEYNPQIIEDLVDRVVPWPQLHQMMSAYKDEGRFRQYRDIMQQRVQWSDRILLPLTEHLYIVEADKGAVVKCDCGHVFGDYRENWKLDAVVYVRRTEEAIAEIYGRFGCHPDWMELREYICPGCATLLEVEAAVPGYPIVFDFMPDLPVFYKEWLNEKAPSGI